MRLVLIAIGTKQKQLAARRLAMITVHLVHFGVFGTQIIHARRRILLRSTAPTRLDTMGISA